MTTLNNGNSYSQSSPNISSQEVNKTIIFSNNSPYLPSQTQLVLPSTNNSNNNSFNSINSGGSTLINASSPNAFSPPISPTNDGSNNINNKMLKTRSQSEEFKASQLPTSDSKKKLFISPKILAPKKSSIDISDEPPISKTLEGRMKSNPYIKKFKLPSNEILLNDYSSALLRQILLHGRLYLFTNYICFESKIFGIKTTEIIQIKDITQIKKKSKKFKYIGIEIETNANQKFSFASFVSRDKTYHDLLSTWKEVTGESHDDASSHSLDDDIDDENSNSSIVFEDDKSAQSHSQPNLNVVLPITTTRKHSIESANSLQQQIQYQQQQFQQLQQLQQFQQQQSQQPQQVENINSSTSIINDSEKQQNQLQISQQNISNNLQEQNVKINEHVINKNSATNNNSNNNNNNNNNNNSNNITTITAPAVIVNEEQSQPKSIDPLDETYGEVEKYLSKKDESSILESQHSDFQELLSENFNVSVVNFFRALCSDQCNFAFNYHTKRGDSNIVVKNWAHRDRFGTIRELEYVAPVNSPIGPDKTRIQETQRYHLVKSKLIIETDTIMLDIPYGDHFRIEAKWECTETSPDTCKLNIHLCVRFIKKTWFKSKIETSTIKESKNSFTQWVTLAKQEIQKLLQIKPKQTALTAPTVSLSSTTTTLISNKNLDNAINRIKEEESPKPHHTRSRSRQHLISSSGQVHTITSPLTVNTQQTSTTTTTTQITTTPTSMTSPFNNLNNVVSSPNPLIPSTDMNDQSSATTAPFKSRFSGNDINSNTEEKKTSSFGVGLISITSPNQIPFLIFSLLLCFVFLYMYLKILTLSSKVETMENIFKDLINKNIQNQHQHHHHTSSH